MLFEVPYCNLIIGMRDVPQDFFSPIVTSPCFKVKKSVEEDNSHYIFVFTE